MAIARIRPGSRVGEYTTTQPFFVKAQRCSKIPAVNQPPEPQQKKSPAKRPPTDYRAIRRREDRRLLWAVIAFLLIVGGGLIYTIYGTGALFTGLACLLFGVGLLLLLWLILTAIERWANR